MFVAPVVNVSALLADVDPARVDAALVDPRAAVSALLAGVPAPGVQRRGTIEATPAIVRRAA